jgi:hypothetical protein
LFEHDPILNDAGESYGMIDPRNLCDQLCSAYLGGEDIILSYNLGIANWVVIENSIPLTPTQQQQR